MPIVQADRLTRISAALLRAAGASAEEADAIACGCVNANLAGHDSHGVIAVSADGDARRHDRDRDGGFRPLAEARGALRRQGGTARHHPISIAVPSDLDAPFYLDMATSAARAGARVQARYDPRPGLTDFGLTQFGEQQHDAADGTGRLPSGPELHEFA